VASRLDIEVDPFEDGVAAHVHAHVSHRKSNTHLGSLDRREGTRFGGNRVCDGFLGRRERFQQAQRDVPRSGKLTKPERQSLPELRNEERPVCIEEEASFVASAPHVEENQRQYHRGRAKADGGFDQDDGPLQTEASARPLE
jgi:hypothetical protein